MYKITPISCLSQNKKLLQRAQPVVVLRGTQVSWFIPSVGSHHILHSTDNRVNSGNNFGVIMTASQTLLSSLSFIVVAVIILLLVLHITIINTLLIHVL